MTPATPSTCFTCPQCSSTVEITKYSREHTITRWPDGHGRCTELTDEPSRFGTGRCETLTVAVRAAFDEGDIEAHERTPGT